MKANICERIMVDCSHGNSFKNHSNQAKVAANIAEPIANGETSRDGEMIESNIKEDRRNVPVNGFEELRKCISITDACITWEDTVPILEMLATVRTNRLKVQISENLPNRLVVKIRGSLS